MIDHLKNDTLKYKKYCQNLIIKNLFLFICLPRLVVTFYNKIIIYEFIKGWELHILLGF